MLAVLTDEQKAAVLDELVTRDRRAFARLPRMPGVGAWPVWIHGLWRTS
jgi:hypothetical protein